MVTRILLTLSPKKGENQSLVKATTLINPYLCVVKQLTRSKACFLLCLQDVLSSFSLLQEGAYWIGKTFNNLAKDLGLSNRVINRIVTSLRQESLIKTSNLSLHPTIRTNYCTINYKQLVESIPEAKAVSSPIKGDSL